MPTKRKSDALDDISLSGKENDKPDAFIANKTRVLDASEAAVESSKPKAKGKAKKVASEAPKQWQNVMLEGEDDESVPIYDNCNEIRRKIRLLQKTPGFKITHWLKEIGDINSNSFSRFMKATGPTGGAGNGTYYAAYVYFEKVRIAEGKKKTPKREKNEIEYYNGFSRDDRRMVWIMPRRF